MVYPFASTGGVKLIFKIKFVQKKNKQTKQQKNKQKKSCILNRVV